MQAPTESLLLTQAQEIAGRLRRRSAVRRRNFALDAFDLLEAKRQGLHETLGFSSVAEFAHAMNGFGASKTSDLIRIADACERLPKTRAAFLAGELDWCAAREIVKKATPEDEAEWLAKAHVLSVTELRALAQDRDPVYRRTLEVSAEELGWLEAVADGVRQSDGPYPLGKALAEACRRALAGEGNVAGGPTHRVLLQRCPVCRAATRETTEGAVPIDPAELGQILCDAEVLDLEQGPAKVSRTAPPRIRNYTLGRDGGRCVVPACTNRAQFHHEDGWRNGHDPARCFGLCDAHHRARHKGLLRVEGSMPDVFFYLLDGTCLGRAGDRERLPDPEVGDDESAPAKFLDSDPATPDPPPPEDEFARAKSTDPDSESAGDEFARAKPPNPGSAEARNEFAHAKPPSQDSEQAGDEFAHAKLQEEDSEPVGDEFAHARHPNPDSERAEDEFAHAKSPRPNSGPPGDEFAHAKVPVPDPAPVEHDFAHAKSADPDPPSDEGALASAGPTLPALEASAALRRLGLPLREAKARVSRVLAHDPGRAWRTDELVLAVLRALQRPG